MKLSFALKKNGISGVEFRFLLKKLFFLKKIYFFSYKFADALSVKPQVLTLGPLLLLINLSH